jgi:uncharacterized protein YlxP (DUF503 family)
MNVGIAKVRLRLPDNLSLKGKRHIVKSLTARIKNKFNVSVAEVEDNDLWQVATIGIGFVSNDKRFTNEVLSKAVEMVVNNQGDFEMLDYEIEILTV